MKRKSFILIIALIFAFVCAGFSANAAFLDDQIVIEQSFTIGNSTEILAVNMAPSSMIVTGNYMVEGISQGNILSSANADSVMVFNNGNDVTVISEVGQLLIFDNMAATSGHLEAERVTAGPISEVEIIVIWDGNIYPDAFCSAVVSGWHPNIVGTGPSIITG